MAPLPAFEGRYAVAMPPLLLASVAISLWSVAAVSLREDASSPLEWVVVEYGLTFVLPAVLIYGAYWLAKSEFTTDELWRTLGWTIGGVAVLAVVAGFVLLHRRVEGGAMVEPVFLVAVLSLLGGVVGFATAVAQLHVGTVPSPERGGASGSGRHRSGDPDRSAADGGEVPYAEVDGPELFRSRTHEQSLSRQWATIRAVASCGDCSLDELARTLAFDPRNSFSSDPSIVAIHLYHHYLPATAESGLLEFDRSSKHVRYAGPETLAC